MSALSDVTANQALRKGKLNKNEQNRRPLGTFKLKVLDSLANVIPTGKELPAEIQHNDRTILWDELKKNPDNIRGTLILAIWYDHLIMWLTDEDIHEKSPVELTDKPQENDFYEVADKSRKRFFSKWCKKRYTDEKSGIGKFIVIRESDYEDFVEKVIKNNNIKKIGIRTDDLEI
ncbi:MAG: hypothetical protein GY795_08300 [Desulfobacterales bacterium]|nr:hypothetical protein [Desulfobacterales bacterium]